MHIHMGCVQGYNGTNGQNGINGTNGVRPFEPLHYWALSSIHVAEDIESSPHLRPNMLWLLDIMELSNHGLSAIT